MDTATLIGIILGVVGVIGGNILEGGSPAALINIPGFMIVIVGSLGAGIMAVPMSTVKTLPKLLGKAFKQQDLDPGAMVPQFEQMADRARREGLLSLEEEAGKIDDEFTRKGMQLIIDGTDPEALREIMETEITSMEERHHQGIGFLEGIGSYAPTLGVLGAIMGLITVLGHLGEEGADLGEGIAVAFVASFYGVFTSNLIWLPLANKLKLKSKDEIQVREIAMEGLLAIQAGDNPRVVKDKLMGYLPPSERLQLDTPADPAEAA
ncbi:MAG: chemotaxis protein MotA [Chloroflexi bacterium]|jgi:chemotaxis protein MotA|nr:MAG: chemotaxis protein MotA [Chloroflexota bacterium]